MIISSFLKAGICFKVWIFNSQQNMYEVWQRRSKTYGNEERILS